MYRLQGAPSHQHLFEECPHEWSSPPLVMNSPVTSQPRTKPSAGRNAGLNPEAPAYAPTPPTTSLWIWSDRAILLQTAKAASFNPSDPRVSQLVQIVLDTGSQRSYGLKPSGSWNHLVSLTQIVRCTTNFRRQFNSRMEDTKLLSLGRIHITFCLTTTNWDWTVLTDSSGVCSKTRIFYVSTILSSKLRFNK